MKFHPYKIVPIDAIKPYERNANEHPDEQIEQIRVSMREFKFTNPVLLTPELDLIAGHGRHIAAKLEGYSELPAIIVEGLSDAQRRALVLADNRIARNSVWNEELLQIELMRLKDDDFDISMLGFQPFEINDLIGEENDASSEWQGMPEFEQPNAMSFRDIVVHFRNQADVDAFAKLVGQQLTDKTKFIWHPKAEKDVTVNERYAAPT